MYSIYKVLVSHNGYKSGMHIRVPTSDIRSVLMAQSGYLKLIEHETSPDEGPKKRPGRPRKKVPVESDTTGPGSGSDVRAAVGDQGDNTSGPGSPERVEEDGA